MVRECLVCSAEVVEDIAEIALDGRGQVVRFAERFAGGLHDGLEMFRGFFGSTQAEEDHGVVVAHGERRYGGGAKESVGPR